MLTEHICSYYIGVIYLQSKQIACVPVLGRTAKLLLLCTLDVILQKKQKYNADREVELESQSPFLYHWPNTIDVWEALSDFHDIERSSEVALLRGKEFRS